ncbi:hypothetical protein [Parafrankia discariae]|uniref:hypothetical protein n=1 Tax=Parafrankia discariae TaxID=365528 RepID=UPI000475632A|nr:hypothetical protein [Parafrankia discariae]
MTVADVYFLAMHDPYRSPQHPVPVNATLVHARTLLHPELPQPDGGRIYRCLTEFPGRTQGCVVPLSTLTYELAGGALWPQVAQWQRVIDALVALTRAGACDATQLGLKPPAEALLANGPDTEVTMVGQFGRRTKLGPGDRQREIAQLERSIRQFVEGGPYWPGDGLVAPPAQPTRMPYQPIGG